MTIQNDFSAVFAYEGVAGTNIYSPSVFDTLSTIPLGNTNGIADVISYNTLARQASIFTGVLSTYIGNKTGQNIINDGTTSTILANFNAAVLTSKYAVDTSTTVNALNVNFLSGLVTIPTGAELTLYPAISNTGAATLTVNGLGPYPIKTPTGALAGGELIATRKYPVVFDGVNWIMEDYNTPDTLALVTGRGNTTSTQVIITNSTTSTSTSTGALILTGGLSTLDNIYAGGTLSVPYITTGGVLVKSTGISLGNTNPTGAPSTVLTTIPTFTLKSSTYTDNTTTTGTLGTIITGMNIVASTFSAINTGVIYTTAASVYISGAPNSGVNVTITNPYALYINSGNSYLNGNLHITGTLLIDTTSTFTGIATFTAAPVFSTAVTLPASSLVTTPAQFDSSTKIASTSFVQTAQGNFQSTISLSSVNTMIASNLGSYVELTGASIFVTTIPTPVGYSGKTLSFFNASTAIQTITSAAGNITGNSVITAGSSYSLSIGQSIELVSDNTNWVILSTTAPIFTTPIATSVPTLVTGTTYTVLNTDSHIIFNTTAACTVTMLSAATYTGRKILVKQIAAFAVNSSGSNIDPLTSTTAGTAILTGAGKFAELISNGLVWVIMASN